MTTTGTEQVAAIFRELEAELGEDVVQAIMDAQRSYIRTAMDKAEMEQGYPYLRRFPAFRGMGNLAQHDLRSEGLEAVVENSSPASMVGGILRGSSNFSATASPAATTGGGEDGNLAVTVRAR